MTGFVRPATVRDAQIVAPRLRQADREEAVALTGLSPELAVPMCVGLATEAYAICGDDGEPFAVYGVTADPDSSPVSSASIWMVSTPELEAHAIPFLRQCRDRVDDFGSRYDLLYNYVDARNTLHHKWLRWCGFTFLHKHRSFGAAGLPFYEFAKCAS